MHWRNFVRNRILLFVRGHDRQWGQEGGGGVSRGESQTKYVWENQMEKAFRKGAMARVPPILGRERNALCEEDGRVYDSARAANDIVAEV